MKTINQFILERLKINKDTKVVHYKYHPKDFDELRSLVKQLLDKRGPDADLNDIDTSNVKRFYDPNKDLGLFRYLDPHNIKIDRWNTGRVVNMCDMFKWCENFNCDLSNWDVSKVDTMCEMFFGCTSFTGKGLENWEHKNNCYKDHMFDGCTSFKNKPSWYK